MGKYFGNRRLRTRSVRWFAREVAPRLRDLRPDRVATGAVPA
jgi:hypothetical protein